SAFFFAEKRGIRRQGEGAREDHPKRRRTGNFANVEARIVHEHRARADEDRVMIRPRAMGATNSLFRAQGRTRAVSSDARVERLREMKCDLRTFARHRQKLVARSRVDNLSVRE